MLLETMLVTVLTNYDCLPKTIEFEGERVPTGDLLYRAKRLSRPELYVLNSQVIGRRGRLLRK